MLKHNLEDLMMRIDNTVRIAVAVMLFLLVFVGHQARAEEQAIAFPATVGEAVAIQNDKFGLTFNCKTGTLSALENKRAGETYQVEGDEFDVEAVEFRTGFADAKLVGLAVENDAIKVDYRSNDLVIQVRYTLRDHFVEKQMTLISPHDYGLKNLVVSRPMFSVADLQIVDYRHPQLGLNKGAEPTHTFFGRTPKGGFFAGVEMSFDASAAKEQQVVLGYSPSMKVKANEKIVCEPVYLGVYRRGSHDVEKKDLPLQSESDAMVAMTSAILPPSNPRLGPFLCGWWSEMWRYTYHISIISLSITSPSPNPQSFPATQFQLSYPNYINIFNSEPWCEQERMGKPFRPDKPEWLMTPYSATCFGYQPSYDWLVKTILDAMEAGQYGAWSMDGDFFGGPGFDGGPGWNGGGGPNGEPGEPWVHPARCQSTTHDHLSSDINYICQRNLTEMARVLRQRYPNLYTFYSRPTMDLGVWATPLCRCVLDHQ